MIVKKNHWILYLSLERLPCFLNEWFNLSILFQFFKIMILANSFSWEILLWFEFSLLPLFIWSDHIVVQQWGNLSMKIFLICQMRLSVKIPLEKCKHYRYVWTCCIKYKVELGTGQTDILVRKKMRSANSLHIFLETGK